MRKNSDILVELKSQTRWLRFLAFNQLKEILPLTLKTKEQRRMYELSDGDNSTHEISRKLSREGIKVSHMTVYNYWRKWNALGIVEPSEKHVGRFQRIVSLKDLNIK